MTQAKFIFLRDCSSTSLAEFVLAHRNREALLRKDLKILFEKINALIEETVENRADVELASFIRSQGSAAFGAPLDARIGAGPEPAPPRKAGDERAPLARNHARNRSR